MSGWVVVAPRHPGVSVVIPSWRRPEGLRRALRALEGQPAANGGWDVVVVASAADPGVHEVVGAERGRLLALPGAPAEVRVVDEPRAGASNARNRGLAESRQIVAFLDDDCTPQPGWLAAVTAPVRSGASAGAGGRVVLDPSVTPPRWLGDALLSYLAQYDRGSADKVLEEPDFVLTANAAFDAELLESVGGFDPELGPNSGRPMVNDDIDLCRKVWAAGGTITYTAGASVVHDLPPSRLRPTYLLRRMHAQGRSDWLLDRAQMEADRSRGIGPALRSLWSEERAILRQGPWHPSVLLHSAGRAARTAGVVREAVSHRPGTAVGSGAAPPLEDAAASPDGGGP